MGNRPFLENRDRRTPYTWCPLTYPVPKEVLLIQSRFYNVRGVKWEARFFTKGEAFPESDLNAPKQGVWARPVTHAWDEAYFVGPSWGSVKLDPDLLHLPEKK